MTHENASNGFKLHSHFCNFFTRLNGKNWNFSIFIHILPNCNLILSSPNFQNQLCFFLKSRTRLRLFKSSFDFLKYNKLFMPTEYLVRKDINVYIICRSYYITVRIYFLGQHSFFRNKLGKIKYEKYKNHSNAAY